MKSNKIKKQVSEDRNLEESIRKQVSDDIFKSNYQTEGKGKNFDAVEKKKTLSFLRPLHFIIDRIDLS